MSKIQVLDQITIDKIAAGEVIERPSSVVKELVENAIDAGATAIVTEIKEGGIAFIRITDNGCGIGRGDVRNAFLRHSTSKIRSVDDLTTIHSLGFRGEALSSIAAVAQVELITKIKEDTFGTSYRIAGGREEGLDDTGAPDGTTFLIRQLFYNIPARRKFLKTAMTEASHVGELMTRLALSHPEISFQFINNGQSKLHTAGNGNLKDVIYHVYGREIAANILEVNYQGDGLKMTGFLGKPLISRGNRNFETYFVNGRYVKSSMISKAIEDAYKDFSMQHKYPFVVLQITVDGEDIDVNVHPTKMELRFHKQQEIYNAVYEAVDKGLHEEELIPHVEVPEPPKAGMKEEYTSSRKHLPHTNKTGATETPISPVSYAVPLSPRPAPQSEKMPPAQPPAPQSVPQPVATTAPAERNLDYFMEQMKKRVQSYHTQTVSEPEGKEKTVYNRSPVQENNESPADLIRESVVYETTEKPAPAKQLNLFDEKLLAKEERVQYRIIGQVFETYWLVEFCDNLYMIDQHAAHERVLYEKTLKGMKTRDFTSQFISPPIVLELTMQESQLLKRYMDEFTRIGFEIEEFGQESYTVRAVPDNLFSIAKKELLMEMIDGLSDEISRNQTSDLIDEKVASMSCKAAVKGNMKLSAAEVDSLIGELLTLENPYHCPHGRPTIIAMTKRELEKKFKRIV